MFELINIYHTGILYTLLVLLALYINDSYKMCPRIEKFSLGLGVCVVWALAWPIVLTAFILNLTCKFIWELK